MPNYSAEAGFFVKKWSFTDTPSASGEYAWENAYKEVAQGGYLDANKTGYDWISADVTDLTGLPGQGSENPASIFVNHALAVINGEYYDPSYGRTYADLQTMDQQVMDGYYINKAITVNGTVYPGMEIRKNDILIRINLKEDRPIRQSY